MIRLALAFVLTLAFAPLGAHAAEMVESRLYFGTIGSDNSHVGKAEWKAFVADDIAPRFPKGFTVLKGQGQWRDEDGKTVIEDTRILIIVHEKTEKAAKDLAAIKYDYTQRFKQRSVFHTESPVKVVK